MSSNTKETLEDVFTFQPEPASRSSVSAFLTSVISSPAKESDGCSRSSTTPHAKRRRSSCRRPWTAKEQGRGRGRRRSTARKTVSRADITRNERDAEEEEELARIIGSSSGESDNGTTIAVDSTLVKQYPSKQNEFDISHVGTVASFRRASRGGRKLGGVGQQSNRSTDTRHTLAAKQLPSRGRKRRMGLMKKSDFGDDELELVVTSSDSDTDKVESAALCTSGCGAVQQARKWKEKEPDSGALKMARPSHPPTNVTFVGAPSIDVTTASGQVEVGEGSMDMSVFVQSIQQQGEDEEDASMREGDVEQILTSDSHSSAGESPSRTEQGAGEWLRRQHLDSPGNEMDDSTTPAKFESTKKKAKYVRGGLAERLRHLASREASDISFWEHSHRQGGKGTCDSSQDTPHQSEDRSSSITVEVTFVTHCCSLFIADCIVRSSSGREVMLCGNGSTGRTIHSSVAQVNTSDVCGVCEVGEQIKVIFTQRSAKFVTLGIGSKVQIFPPWCWVGVSSGNTDKVLIGAHFCTCVVASEEPVCHSDTKKGSSLMKDSMAKKLFD